jgi:hypothetical protein
MIEEFKRDYNWVINVLKSCKKQSHLDTTEKCYKQFKKKWSKFFNSKNIEMDKLTYDCDEEFNIILNHKRKTLSAE